MNTRIDLLVETLKHADSMICKQTDDSKPLLEQIREKRKQKKEGEQSNTAYQYFKKQMKNVNNEHQE